MFYVRSLLCHRSIGNRAGDYLGLDQAPEVLSRRYADPRVFSRCTFPTPPALVATSQAEQGQVLVHQFYFDTLEKSSLTCSDRWAFIASLTADTCQAAVW